MDTSSHQSRWKRIALVASVLGAGVIYLWQPITELFFTRAYDENVVVAIETETLKAQSTDPLLVIRVRISNRGAVPAWIKNEDGKGELTLEVNNVSGTSGQWIDEKSVSVVAKTDLLDGHKGGYVIAPNAYFEEVESIPLPKGNYLLKATLKFPDGDYIDQRSFIHHSE